jgi:hypothetical protein
MTEAEHISNKNHYRWYVQYHNADERGFPDTNETNINEIQHTNNGAVKLSIYSKKTMVKNSVGGNCILLVGTGKYKKEFYLWEFFKIETVVKDEDGYIVAGTGNVLSKPVLLNNLDGFPEFLKTCGNFAWGFKEISAHPFLSVLKNHLTQRFEKLDNKIRSLENAKKRIHDYNEQMQNIKPEKVKIEMEKIIRNDTAMVNLLKEVANYSCQYPGCNAEIKTKTGNNYVEVAHVQPVKQGGQSILGNLIVLCPNHHKEFDYGNLELRSDSNDELSGKLNGQSFTIKLFL